MHVIVLGWAAFPAIDIAGKHAVLQVTLACRSLWHWQGDMGPAEMTTLTTINFLTMHTLHLRGGCRGKHKEATECFRLALALRPSEARTLFKLGNACFALQDLADAEEAFDLALRVRALPALHLP